MDASFSAITIPEKHKKSMVDNLYTQLDSIHHDLYKLKNNINENVNLQELAQIYELINAIKKNFNKLS